MFSGDAFTWHAKELGAWYWEDPAKGAVAEPERLRAGDGHADARDPRPRSTTACPISRAWPTTTPCRPRHVDSRLVWFPDENHWILKPRNSKLWYAEFFDWLRRHDPGAKAERKRKR